MARVDHGTSSGTFSLDEMPRHVRRFVERVLP